MVITRPVCRCEQQRRSWIIFAYIGTRPYPVGSVPRDTAHLFSGKPAILSAGIAFVGTVCASPSSSYGVSGYVSWAPGKYLIPAHEIGHNLGGNHAEVAEGCGNTIMNAFLTGSAQLTFCAFSRNEIGTYISGHGTCLTGGSPTPTPTPTPNPTPTRRRSRRPTATPFPTTDSFPNADAIPDAVSIPRPLRQSPRTTPTPPKSDADAHPESDTIPDTDPGAHPFSNSDAGADTFPDAYARTVAVTYAATRSAIWWGFWDE